MNYLTFGNNQPKIYATTDIVKNDSVTANAAKTLSPVVRGKGMFTVFLMISCLLLTFMPKNSVASGLGIFSPTPFCENECSKFVSVPASFGEAVGAVAGVSVGVGLGIPISIGMGANMAVSGHKSEEILQEVGHALRFGLFVAAAAGAEIVSNVVALPFWMTETIVYDAPLKMVNLVRRNF